MPKKTEDQKGHFNAQREITKYKLDHSTFDLIDVDKFHNTSFSTVCGYLWVWILIFLSWVLLGVDIYTCLNILVFHKWSSSEYKPYAYSIAKWIFTGCIIFQFCLLLYHWVRAIRAYRTKNIALAYVNVIAKILYTVRSYNYYCLFHKIGTDNSFDFACFLTYTELDNALQILVADTPRQVINILTLRYYATDGELSNDIIANIKEIATTNIRLSIILSFMCLSVIIWSIFFFKFILGMLMFIPVIVKLRNRGYKSLKKYCCKIVNDKVRSLVLKHHRPKNELLERGIMDLKELKANPLLNSSTMDFELDSSNKGLIYNDNNKLKESYSMQTLRNPFDDTKTLSVDSFSDRERNIAKQARDYSVDSFHKNSITDPFEDSRANLIGNTFGERNQSLSSLTYDNPNQTNSQYSAWRSQTQPIPQFDRSYSEPNIAGDKKILRRPETLATETLEDPFDDVDFLTASDGSIPYPQRGISLYDKNYRRVIQSSDHDDSIKTNMIYPLEEVDEEKIKGVYPKKDIADDGASDSSEESDNDIEDIHELNRDMLLLPRSAKSPQIDGKEYPDTDILELSGSPSQNEYDGDFQEIYAENHQKPNKEYPDKDILPLDSEDEVLDNYLDDSGSENELRFSNTPSPEKPKRSSNIYPKNDDLLDDLKFTKRNSTLKGMYPQKEWNSQEPKQHKHTQESESEDDYDFNDKIL